MGLRDAVAFEHGSHEGLLDAARKNDGDNPPQREALDVRQTAALDVADAYLGLPSGLSAGEWTRLAAILSPIGVAELAIHLTKFSRNKVRVSFGLDLSEVSLRMYRPAALALDRVETQTELP